MNAVLTWTRRRVPPASIRDEWARSRGVHYHVSPDNPSLPQTVCYGATADGLNLGRFNGSSGHNAARAACQRHTNQIGDYLDGASSCRDSADDRARIAKRLRATHAALTLVLSSYQLTH